MTSPKSSLDYDVVIVGAGISGINFAYRLQERNPELSYIILEGRHEIGGTWSLFQYPGIRSDSDLFTFGFLWRPWIEKTAIAEGSSILTYVKQSAELYGIDQQILYNHKVDAASWSSEEKAWTLDTTVNNSAKKIVRTRWMQLCTGYYDYETPLQVVIPGIDNFQGKVIHPQFWKKDVDFTNQNVVIIGSGATAVTILPALARIASHVTMLQRSPSYLLSRSREDAVETFLRAWLPGNAAYRAMRFRAILQGMLATTLFRYFPGPSSNFVKKAMTKELPASVPVDPHFNPRYNVFEQRLCLCPDGDFYEPLHKGMASVATGTIDTITSDTIRLHSGQELFPDIIVTATGLKLQAAGGVAIRVDGTPYDPSQKYFWKGVMLEDLPNAAITIGYIDASWTLGADATAQLVTRILNKMHNEGVTEVVPRCSEAEKRVMQEKPVFNLSSTYVKAGASLLPKGGNRWPWKPRSYYYQDILMAWYGSIRNGLEWARAA